MRPIVSVGAVAIHRARQSRGVVPAPAVCVHAGEPGLRVAEQQVAILAECDSLSR